MRVERRKASSLNRTCMLLATSTFGLPLKLLVAQALAAEFFGTLVFIFFSTGELARIKVRDSEQVQTCVGWSQSILW